MSSVLIKSHTPDAVLMDYVNVVMINVQKIAPFFSEQTQNKIENMIRFSMSFLIFIFYSSFILFLRCFILLLLLFNIYFSRLVCFLVEFWTVLPCLLMFTNTITYAFGCYPWKQLYLIAFVDLVPVATEKVSLIRSNTVWNRRKSILSARSIRVNLNHGKEM